MTHIIIFIRQTPLAHPDIPPPFAPIIFTPIQIQRQGQRDLHAVVDMHWVELRVDVEGQGGLLVVAGRGQAGDALVFCAVDAEDCEGVFEEDGLGHDGGGLED